MNIPAEPALEHWVRLFLADLALAQHSPHTLHAYAADLAQFCAFGRQAPGALTAAGLDAFMAQFAHLSPATRARKHAALTSFVAWAVRQPLIPADPLNGGAPRKPAAPAPRAVSRAAIATVLAAIPTLARGDQLFFGLLFEAGLAVREGLGLYGEEIALTPGQARLRVQGKGGRWRWVWLDAAPLVEQLRTYCEERGGRPGLVFRAGRPGQDGPWTATAVQARWAAYCVQAGVTCTLAQLQHSRGAELRQAGVRPALIRRRLGQRIRPPPGPDAPPQDSPA